MTKKKGIFAALISVVLVLFCFLYFLPKGGIENSERLYVNAVLMGFTNVKAEVEREIAGGREIADLKNMSDKWKKTVGKIDGMDDMFFDQSGRVIAISDRFDLVIMIKPASGAWTCKTYPRPSFESLCTKLAKP